MAHFGKSGAHGVIADSSLAYEGTIGFGVRCLCHAKASSLTTGDGAVQEAGGTVDVLPYNSLGQARTTIQTGGRVKLGYGLPRSR